MIKYEAIHKAKIEYQIQERYRPELAQLRESGFTELHFAREVAFPFSAIALCWIIPYLKLKKEIFQIETPLRLVSFQPLLFNHQYDTYANVYGLGTSFYTLFADDTVMTTKTFLFTQMIRPDLKYYCYCPDAEMSIPVTWQKHIEHLYEIETKGRETRQDLSLENYEKISRRSDKAQVLGR